MDIIEKQYQTPAHLYTRISIHEKYSVNKQPFGDWIYSHYSIAPGDRVLELGCGTADMWKGRLPFVQEGVQLILTDFSKGMLRSAMENTAGQASGYALVDIQDIPFEDGSFDVVIANMMLYHVPDLARGLSEVRRVLRPGGVFYCATYGENGIMAYINETLKDHGIQGHVGNTFTLQNGRQSLEAHFDQVEKRTREDGLAITAPEDFVDYVMSMSSLTGIVQGCEELLLEVFRNRMENGILYVPKEYGMFICK